MEENQYVLTIKIKKNTRTRTFNDIFEEFMGDGLFGIRPQGRPLRVEGTPAGGNDTVYVDYAETLGVAENMSRGLNMEEITALLSNAAQQVVGNTNDTNSDQEAE